jgi:hypothetical protein
MTTQRDRGGTQDPMAAGAQAWEAGYQSLMAGWQQAQEFWTSAARSWGEAAGAWMGQLSQSGGGVSAEGMEVVRELNEAAFAVAQAWMRLPLVFLGGAQPDDLQQAVTRLSQAQGRAFELWTEALSRAGGAVEATAERASGRTRGDGARAKRE